MIYLDTSAFAKLYLREEGTDEVHGVVVAQSEPLPVWHFLELEFINALPQGIARKLGIRPGWKLEWREGQAPDEIVVRVIPDRAELGRRLRGRGKAFSPERDSTAELVAEREADG